MYVQSKDDFGRLPCNRDFIELGLKYGGGKKKSNVLKLQALTGGIPLEALRQVACSVIHPILLAF